MTKEQITKIRQIGKDISILYVEDDPLIAKEVQTLLKKIFTRVDYVDNGKKAFKLYEKKIYDIVITDIRLPELDGISLAKKIKDIYSDQIIIVISAYDETKYFTQMINLGVDRFILKPIDMKQFMIALSKIVINIYNKKKSEKLEQELIEKLKLKETLLQKMMAPIVIIDGDKVRNANEKFYDCFGIPESFPLQQLYLKELFQEPKLTVLDNEELLKTLFKDNGSTRTLFINQQKETERFVVKITKICETDITLMCFFNVERINAEIDRIQQGDTCDYTTGFYTREAFVKTVEKAIYDNEQDYEIVCFSLKNIKELIHMFGVATLQTIYEETAKKLKLYLPKTEGEEDKEVIKLHYFNPNHFVALVHTKDKEDFLGVLEKFSQETDYVDPTTKVSKRLRFDKLSFTLDTTETPKHILAETENKLYMLFQ